MRHKTVTIPRQALTQGHCARPRRGPGTDIRRVGLLVTSADFPDSVLTVDLDNDNRIEVIRLTRNPSRQARPSSQPSSRRRRGVAARRSGSSAPAEPKLAKGDWRAYRRVGARLSRTLDSRPYPIPYVYALPPLGGISASAAGSALRSRAIGAKLTGDSVARVHRGGSGPDRHWRDRAQQGARGTSFDHRRRHDARRGAAGPRGVLVAAPRAVRLDLNKALSDKLMILEREKGIDPTVSLRS